MKYAEMEYIIESFTNGQKKQMCDLIDDYGHYDFWADLEGHIKDYFSMNDGLTLFTGITIAYARIRNR